MTGGIKKRRRNRRDAEGVQSPARCTPQDYRDHTEAAAFRFRQVTVNWNRNATHSLTLQVLRPEVRAAGRYSAFIEAQMQVRNLLCQ